MFRVKNYHGVKLNQYFLPRAFRCVRCCFCNSTSPNIPTSHTQYLQQFSRFALSEILNEAKNKDT